MTSREFGGGLPFELLYADDLVITDTEEEVIRKLNFGRKALEQKGLRVSLSKNKLMQRKGVI